MICEKMNLSFNKKKFNSCLESINFNKLKQMEKNSKFPESVNENQNFFRKGIVDEWVDKVPNDIIQEIEKKFKPQMEELGYL